MNTAYRISRHAHEERTAKAADTSEKEKVTMFKKIFNSLYSVSINRYLKSEFPEEYKEYREIYRQYR